MLTYKKSCCQNSEETINMKGFEDDFDIVGPKWLFSLKFNQNKESRYEGLQIKSKKSSNKQQATRPGPINFPYILRGVYVFGWQGNGADSAMF